MRDIHQVEVGMNQIQNIGKPNMTLARGRTFCCVDNESVAQGKGVVANVLGCTIIVKLETCTSSHHMQVWRSLSLSDRTLSCSDSDIPDLSRFSVALSDHFFSIFVELEVSGNIVWEVPKSHCTRIWLALVHDGVRSSSNP